MMISEKELAEVLVRMVEKMKEIQRLSTLE